MRLERATALVTGANSGIGQAVTSRFRREGARLLLTAAGSGQGVVKSRT